MASFQELAWLTFLSVGSLIAAKVNTEMWLNIDAIITIFFAVATIPFAAESQQMQTVGLKIDTQHVYMTNIYICFCLMPAIAWFLMNKSKDKPHLMSAVLLCRTVGIGLATAMITLGHLQSNYFNSMHLYYGVLGNAAWALVNGYHLYSHGVIYGSGKGSKLNFFLKLDIYLCLFYGLSEVLTPRLICFLQVLGATELGSAILSYMALSFSSDSNRRAVLLSRLGSTGLRWTIRTYLWMFVDTDTSFYNYFYACLGYIPFLTGLVGLIQTV